jgi:hypothetical protein
MIRVKPISAIKAPKDSAAGGEDSSPGRRGFADKPIFSHSAGGPLGGIVDKIKELQQRFQDTPGGTTQERFVVWYDERCSEYAADATGVNWPSATWTKLWKFFFKANRGTTDRYGFAIKMGPADRRTDAERADARARSAASLVNIDPQERTRRTVVGLSLVAAAVATGALLLGSPQGLKPPLDESEATTLAGNLLGGALLRLGDDGVSFLMKAAVVPPFAFGSLLAISGASGL